MHSLLGTFVICKYVAFSYFFKLLPIVVLFYFLFFVHDLYKALPFDNGLK